MAKPDKLVELAKAHLDEGETVEAAVAGVYETKSMGQDTARNGVLIATDRRVLFYAKRLGGFDMESFPFGNISSFEQGKNMMGHNITIHASGNRVHVKWMNPAQDVARLTDIVKAAMNAKHSAPAKSAPGSDVPDAMSQLKQLGELRDAGVLTDDEFEQKKADLLGRI